MGRLSFMRGRGTGVEEAISRRINRRRQPRPQVIATTTPSPGVVLPAPEDRDLVTHLNGVYASRTHRGFDYLHVSDVLHKCPRMLAICKHISSDAPIPNLFEGERITFAIGKAIETLVVSDMVQDAPELVYGTWSCDCGERRHKSTRAEVPATACDTCNTPMNNYNELVIFNEDMMLSGSIDITLYDGVAFQPVEIKSTKGKSSAQFRGFDSIVEQGTAMPDHIIQAMFYWYLMYLDGMPVYDSLSILYVNKEFSMRRPYHEIKVPVTPELVEQRLTDYIADADKIVRADTLGLPEQDSGCAVGYGKGQSKRCSVATLCYSLLED